MAETTELSEAELDQVTGGYKRKTKGSHGVKSQNRVDLSALSDKELDAIAGAGHKRNCTEEEKRTNPHCRG